MKTKIQWGLVWIIMLVGMLPAMAQDESPTPLAWMIGEWSVTSHQNVDAYRNQSPASAAEWQTTEGVAQIVSLMEGTAVLERYISTVDEHVYEQTFFLGLRNEGRSWDAANTDNLINQLLYLKGNRVANILTIAETGSSNRPRWQVEIEQLSDDQFEWRMMLLEPDQNPELIWTKHYTKLNEPMFVQFGEQLRSTLASPPPPNGMSDFHFWLGSWQVDHHRFEDVVDRIELASGGHAMIEFWQARNLDNPPAFFTMTIWDEQLGGYHNWLWAKLGSTQEFKGGTCEGEGADKQCRLAGVFYNITEQSIDWKFNGTNWTFHRIASIE